MAPLFTRRSVRVHRTSSLGAEARPELRPGREDPIRWVVIAAERITDVDTTGAEVLGRVLDELEGKRIALALAELKGPVKDALRRYGLCDRIGDDHLFPTLGTAINAYLGETGTDWVDWSDQGAPPARPSQSLHIFRRTSTKGTEVPGAAP